MKKFDLKEARAAEADSAVITGGFYGAVITQVAEVGLQPGFTASDAPRDMIGLVFELATGQALSKLGAASANPRGMLGQALAAVDVDATDLQDLLGAKLVLEIEENGRYPRVAGYMPVEDVPDAGADFEPKGPLLFYSVAEPDPEVLKQLHRDLRGAVAARLRLKGGAA